MSRARGTTTLSRALHAGATIPRGSSAGSQLIAAPPVLKLAELPEKLMRELVVNPTVKKSLGAVALACGGYFEETQLAFPSGL
jgi:hypothetical protein